MSRWEPGARERLERAALDLFVEHGFDDVTVPQITARAGLTTRTFFRHFADKREVLFSEADRMPALVAQAGRRGTPERSPVDVVRLGLPSVAEAFEGRLEQACSGERPWSAGTTGCASASLRKMEALVEAIASAFRDRGVEPLTAAVVAETVVGVVKVALRRWIDSGGAEPLAGTMQTALQRVGSSFGPPQAAD
ncbi:TetR family transcriptional regulator [Angustibacter aerolatus]|uniref:TetR family transcriptional regulator n=1 Tax=Angustibacter aerolatus TaxID=1162965 RepID=A0ABQ6JG89_9ACTN|nr:TetR family transcriptional regulator [Angustibacter aerolatus]GMA87236.1 TetR family transcriptional regulator [Angustibacter aerolatus]